MPATAPTSIAAAACRAIALDDARASVFQFLSRYPVLKIHPMMHRQATKNPMVILKLTPMFTSAVP